MNTKKLSTKQEKQLAKQLDGKRQPNSGATLFQKGDVILKKYGILLECKTKMDSSKSFTIKKEWLEKNKEDAFGMGCIPSRSTMAFDFGDDDGTYFIISYKFFKEILSLLENDFSEENK